MRALRGKPEDASTARSSATLAGRSGGGFARGQLQRLRNCVSALARGSDDYPTACSQAMNFATPSGKGVRGS